MPRPFKFGIQSYVAESGADWRDQVRAAEDLGYSVFTVADHYIGPGPALDRAAHPIQNIAAVPAMAVAAAITDTIMIGCKVFCVDYHHPVVLAKELATIDMMSEGRLEVGLGAGWVAAEYEAMGITLDRPGIRIERLEAVADLVRRFLAGESLDIRSEYVTAFDFDANPVSPQPGGPKLMIGGGAPRILGMAGRIADIISINLNNKAGTLKGPGVVNATAEATLEKVGWIRDGAGDRFDDIELEIAAYFAFVGDGTAAVADGMAGAFGITPDEMRAHPHALFGSVDEVVAELERRREAYGISYITVGDEAMEAFAPVVAKLAGS